MILHINLLICKAELRMEILVESLGNSDSTVIYEELN